MTPIVKKLWCLLLGLCCFSGWAYPPGPYHIVFGTVLDQYGTPIGANRGQVIFQTASGLQFAAPIIPSDTFAGVNYVLKVPLDSGSAPDLYQPNVLLPANSYKLMVALGSVTNLPIEIGTNNLSLGLWTRSTRVDLTLGVDSNGDGLPDAWEYALLAMLGTNIPLSQLNANSVLTPDGRTLRENFLLGTVLFDPGNPLKVTFLGFTGPSPVLQFPTVNGRTYSVLASSDLKTWAPAKFNLLSEVIGTQARSFYQASAVASLQIYVAPPPSGVNQQFYRVSVQ